MPPGCRCCLFLDTFTQTKIHTLCIRKLIYLFNLNRIYLSLSKPLLDRVWRTWGLPDKILQVYMLDTISAPRLQLHAPGRVRHLRNNDQARAAVLRQYKDGSEYVTGYGLPHPYPPLMASCAMT